MVMAEERIAVVTIDPKGTKLTVDLEGFHGDGCKAIADAFNAIGPRISEEQKPEIYDNNNQNVLRQGS
jgi:hypothetical protein